MPGRENWIGILCIEGVQQSSNGKVNQAYRNAEGRDSNPKEIVLMLKCTLALKDIRELDQNLYDIGISGRWLTLGKSKVKFTN